jgi:hypothetical protein
MSPIKGACVGTGGTIIRPERKACLQNPYEEQIMKPRQLHEWAVVKILSVTFEYCTVKERGEHGIIVD